MSKKKQENPKITKNFEYTDGRYQIKGTLWQHYILMNLIGKYNCQFLGFDSSEIDDLIYLLQTIKEYEKKESVK